MTATHPAAHTEFAATGTGLHRDRRQHGGSTGGTTPSSSRVIGVVHMPEG
ncbi:hypothetical protein [Streptomyces canus]|nr:hypothetical protein [Streptomyces canus]